MRVDQSQQTGLFGRGGVKETLKQSIQRGGKGEYFEHFILDTPNKSMNLRISIIQDF